MRTDAPIADHRDCIIEAAHNCLSEPHSGPIPVAAILERAGLSTRAFYRHFESKDGLFLAMLRKESDALVDRLDHIADNGHGGPADQLRAWIEEVFGLPQDPLRLAHLLVLDSDEVHAARGYREARESCRADRERSLATILRRGRRDGSFPLADPDHDAMAISAMVSRVMTKPYSPSGPDPQHALACVFDFTLRPLGAERDAGRR